MHVKATGEQHEILSANVNYKVMIYNIQNLEF